MSKEVPSILDGWFKGRQPYAGYRLFLLLRGVMWQLLTGYVSGNLLLVTANTNFITFGLTRPDI
jgi:hypothetical protein